MYTDMEIAKRQQRQLQKAAHRTKSENTRQLLQGTFELVLLKRSRCYSTTLKREYQ